MIKYIYEDEEKYLSRDSLIIVPSSYEFYYKNKYISKNYDISTFNNFLISLYDQDKKIVNKNLEFLFMKKAFKISKKELKNYYLVNNNDFIFDLINTYRVFGNYNLLPTKKVEDLKIIFNNYEQILSNNNIISDNMLASYIIDNVTLNKNYVFLGFDNFTDQEMKIFKKMALEGNVIFKVSTPYNFNFLEKLGCNEVKKLDIPQNKKINFKALNDIEEELLFVLNDITKKTLNGANFGEFAIVSNDISGYIPYVELLFNVPFTKEVKSNILINRFIKLFLKALKSNFSCESVINLLKLNLFSISPDMVNLIDNYVYSWNLEKESFYLPFEFNPSGNKKYFSEKDKELLEKINEEKEAIINPIKYFLENIIDENDTQSIIKWFYTYLEEEKICENLFKIDKESYNSFIDALEDVSSYYVEKTTIIEVLELLSSMLEVTKNKPIMNNEILISDFETACLYDKKYIYFLGANEELLPRTFSFSSLINEEDISKDNLISILNDFSLREEYLFKRLISYDNVTITYHKLSSDLKLKNMSKMLKKVELSEAFHDKLYNNQIIMNDYAIMLSENKINKINDDYDLLNKINNSNSHNLNSFINQKHARQLFGENLICSPSSIETFSKCAFYHFCLYGLKLKVKEKYVFDNREVGTFVHYVLEKIIKNELPSITTENISEKILKYSKNYLSDNNKIVTPSAQFVIERLSYSTGLLIKNIIKEQAVSKFKPKYFEFRLDDENVIKPFLVNLDNGSLKVTGVIDRVDVCETDDEFYYRVIDYKTGDKKFRLDDCIEGLNLQMVLYLLAIRESNKTLTNKKIIPSGLLYYPALVKESTVSRSLPEEELYLVAVSKNKMTGIINRDDKVIELMGDSEIGNYIDVTSRGKINEEKTFGIDNLNLLFENVKSTLEKIGNEILSGNININPAGGRIDSCSYCKFSSICKFDENIDKFRKVKNYKNSEIFKMLEGDLDA